MNRWTSSRIVLVLLASISLSLAALAGGETNIGVTVEPPTTGGGADIQSTDIADLDLVVSPDSPLASSMVTLLVRVDQAVASISIGAEIANKSKLKIKWYNLLENGHLLIGGTPGGPADTGNGWQFGTVWQSEGTGVAAGDYEIQIPIALDLSAGGSVNPRDIPAGSTNGKATIVWTILVGTL
ncbi:MAG: hypothetical protein WBC63_09990 [Candidatus Bipolaricaulia bacterium]